MMPRHPEKFGSNFQIAPTSDNGNGDEVMTLEVAVCLMVIGSGSDSDDGSSTAFHQCSSQVV